MPTHSKRCPSCRRTKTARHFSLRSNGKWLRSLCRVCENKKGLARHHADKKRSALAFRRWKVKSAYGISLEKLEQLHTESKGLCAICSQRHQTRPRLDVDHDHTTGKFRGLLCGGCNSGIGYFRESVSRLQAAIQYLERHGG